MKLTEVYLSMLSEKKIKYNMQNVNGGFSDGVSINVANHPGAVSVSVNVYGGGELNSVKFKVPSKIAEFQEAYISARRTGDQISNDLSTELNSYKSNLKKSIGLAIVKLMEKFDVDAKVAISDAVARVNNLYAESEADVKTKQATKPKPKPAVAAANAPNTVNQQQV